MLVFGGYDGTMLNDVISYTVIGRLRFRTFQCKNFGHFKETLLEIGFTKDMRSTSGNKKVLQIFFYNSPSSPKYDLIRLIPYDWQPCFSQFCDINKRLIL